MKNTNTTLERLIADSYDSASKIGWSDLASDAKLRVKFLKDFLLNYEEIHGKESPDFVFGSTVLLEDIEKDLEKLLKYCVAADIYMYNTKDLVMDIPCVGEHCRANK